jgi:hypothetical protein
MPEEWHGDPKKRGQRNNAISFGTKRVRRPEGLWSDRPSRRPINAAISDAMRSLGSILGKDEIDSKRPEGFMNFVFLSQPRRAYQRFRTTLSRAKYFMGPSWKVMEMVSADSVTSGEMASTHESVARVAVV